MLLSKLGRIVLVFLFCISSTSLPKIHAESFLSRQKAPTGESSRKDSKIANAIKSYFDFFSSEENSEEELASPRTRPLYNQATLSKISLMIQKKDCGAALDFLEKLVVAFDGTDGYDRESLKEFESYLFIETHFCLENYDKTVKRAKVYLSRYSEGKRYFRVYYFLAGALFSLEKPMELTSLVTKEHFSVLSEDEASSLKNFLIRDALDKSQILKAFSFLEDDQNTLASHSRELANFIIKRIRKEEYVEEALTRYENDWIKFPLLSRKLQLMSRDGKRLQAEDYLKFLRDRRKVSSEEWLRLKESVEVDFRVDPSRIGVILPFSHKRFGRLAQEVMDGLEMALRDSSASDNPIKLILKDSADLQGKTASLPSKLKVRERAKLVQKQVEELVEKDKVIAILGPLTRNASSAAGKAAEKYNIPVISFSKTENIGKDNLSLFRFQDNKLEEAKIMARYAMDYLGAERFVLLYNSGEKGFRVMKAFEREVGKKGGKVVGAAEVHTGQADLNNIFLSVTGGFKKISEEHEEELNQLRESLDPIIDFDAIFVPFDLKTLKTTANFADLFNADKVWLLAGSEINVRENRLLGNLRRLVFTGSFPVSRGMDEDMRPFFEAHWQLYGYRSPYYPPEGYTIYSYEALKLLLELLNVADYHSSRESLRDNIASLKDFPMLTGRANVSKNGEILKEQKILRLRRAKTVEVF